MQKIAPYIIQHLQLEDEIDTQAHVLVKGGSYYCVLWWRDIPLCHVYIDSYDGSTNSLKEIVSNNIQPALCSYATDQQVISNCQQALISGSNKLFSSIIKKLLQPFLIDTPPFTLDMSVVICTRQRSEDLDRCLKSLEQQTFLPHEILVIDNAPIDDSTKKVVEKYEKVTYCLETNAGLDFARNAGAQIAKFEIVAYVDDDVTLHPLWSYRVWQTFQDPSIAAMTGLVLAMQLDTESQQIFEKVWGFNKGFADIRFDDKFLSKHADPPKVWDIGAGANMAFRKSILQKVNYFDERLDVGAAGCSGDSEIWYRILYAGHIISYNPRAVVFHQHRSKLSNLKRQIFHYMRGHIAAILIQDQQDPSFKYKRRVYITLPKYYFLLTIQGFPRYSFRYRTLWSEIKGIMSGIKYYHRNKHVRPITKLH